MAAVSLELTGISKLYPGVLALDRVSLECRPGEIHAVLGENGSGKSTLLGIAGGAIGADEGRVTIMGEILADADPLLARRLGLATVYQDDSLVRELTVAENLLLGALDGAANVSGKREWAAKLLAPYDLGIAADALVGTLNPAQRQFLEIVKALAADPKVLLLDEPTSSLDISGVEKLSAIIHQVVAKGAAVVYVSHRLPEILALADRVTILRDGQGQGTYEVNDRLSENDLISLMVGRPIDTEYPEGSAPDVLNVALSASGLSGSRFADVALMASKGEILGFAGAEGNGQREALRALGGLEECGGYVVCDGKSVKTGTPRAALDAGILSLSADRAAELIFPALGVRENMTVQVLGDFTSGGVISAPKETARTLSLVDQLNIVTATLDQPISGLSGGNQQKAVLARSFLYDAKVVLIDEPTQGVDAKARFDIYRAIRAKADQGVAVIVNSSDAMELAGLCDRVLVFSRGRIIRELVGPEITEESIVSSFLRSKEVAAATKKTIEADDVPWLSMANLRQIVGRGSNQWWVPLLFLAVLTFLVSAYASIQTDAFLTPLNIKHILLATAPLALVTMAQFNVLMVRGFDISVGAVISLTVCIASFLMADGLDLGPIPLGILVCLVIGIVVGLANGLIIRKVGINSVITTIAMLSVVQGAALYLRPAPGGVIDEDFVDFLQTRVAFVPISFFLILACAIAGDYWLYRTRSGLKLRAVGFREEAAKRNGVRINFVHLRAFFLSEPHRRRQWFLRLFRGRRRHADHRRQLHADQHRRGGAGRRRADRRARVLRGCDARCFVLRAHRQHHHAARPQYRRGHITSGVLTLFAVLLYSGWAPIRRLWANIRGVLRPLAGAAGTS